MKCNKCGHENIDSNKFCEECGNPLNNQEEMGLGKGEPLNVEESKKKNTKKIILIVSACILGAILIAVGITGFLYFQKVSAINSGIKNGEAFLNEKKFNEALGAFDGVLKIDSNNTEAIFGKAKAYSGLTDYKTAKTYFEEALKNEKDLEKLKLIFNAYIDSEVKNKATEETLFALLERATRETGDEGYIKQKADYMVKIPSFNLNPGTYQGTQSLEIIKGDSADKVYYTINGSEPSIGSAEYTAAIQLVLGEHIIKAIEVGTNAYPSKIIEGKYIIVEIPTTSGGSQGSTDNTSNYQKNYNFSIYASSTLPDMGGISYYVGNIMDQNDNTAWVEGVSGDGIGEYIKCVYTGSQPMTLHGFSIKTGYVKNSKSFAENGSPGGIQVYVNTSPIYYMSIARIREEQTFSISSVTINPGDSVVFVIDSVVLGPEDGDHDTAISEITLF